MSSKADRTGLSPIVLSRILAEAASEIGLGGWEYHPDSGRLIVTDEVRRMFTLYQDELISADVLAERLIPEDRLRLLEAFHIALRTGEGFDDLLRMRGPYGSQRWIRVIMHTEPEGGTIRLFGSVQDVTHTKRAQDEIRQLSLVATKTNNAVIITDLAGRTVWVNDGFTRITGYPHSEALGKKPGALLQGPDTDPETVARVRDFLERQVPFRETILNYGKDGRPYWIEMDISPMSDEEGHCTGFIAIETEVTERVRFQQELQRSLSEKSALLKEVHHRVKNNLAIISGLFYLELDNVQDEAARDLLLDSQSRIRSMALVHELVYRSESLAEIDLNPYLDGLIHHVERTLRRNTLQVTIRREVDPIKVPLDRSVPLALLINEVLVNAYKHAFKGRERGTLHIRFSALPTEWVLFIADDGIGMADVAGAKTSGSLGLQLIRTLTEQLQGKLVIHSEPGKGTSFDFRFPLN